MICKFLGNRAHELLGQNKRVLFAFEEAIGFMFGTAVLDKDGICAAAHLATMVLYLQHHGLTLIQQLEEIFQEYGQHVSCNSYFICHDAEKIKAIFERLRNWKKPNAVSLINLSLNTIRLIQIQNQSYIWTILTRFFMNIIVSILPYIRFYFYFLVSHGYNRW